MAYSKQELQSGWVVKVGHHIREYCETVAVEHGVKPQRILRRLIADGIEHRERLTEQLKVR
jgi:hypothetical protein